MIPRSVTAPFRLVGTSASPVILPPGVLGDTGRGRVRSSLLVWCRSDYAVMVMVWWSGRGVLVVVEHVSGALQGDLRMKFILEDLKEKAHLE